MSGSSNVYSPPLDTVMGAPDLLDPTGWGGTRYYLDPTNGSDGNSGLSRDDAFATLPTAYAAIPANLNNVLVYIAGTSSITLSAAFTWSKSYTHFVGETAPSITAGRARIFQLSTLTGASPLFTVSASSCIFMNIYTFQGVNDNASLINWLVSGSRNYFEGMHFAGGGHATQAIDGGASLKITGSENRFVDCVVGVDTIPAATGMVGILFDSEASRNRFEGCDVVMYAGHTGAAFVEVADGTGIDRYTLFKKGCNFINSNSDNFLMASGFVIPAFAGNNSSRILIDPSCMIHGTTKLDADDRGVLFGGLNAYTGADLSGVAVQLIS